MFNFLLGKGSSNTVNISFSLINGSYFLLQYYLNSKCWNACEMTCLTKTQKFLLFFLEHWIEICSCQLQLPNEMAHNIKIIEVVNHRSRWSGDIVMPHSEIHVKNPIPRSSDIFAVFNHFSIKFFLCILTEPFLPFSAFPTFYPGDDKILIHFIWKPYFQETDDISVDYIRSRFGLNYFIFLYFS